MKGPFPQALVKAPPSQGMVPKPENKPNKTPVIKKSSSRFESSSQEEILFKPREQKTPAGAGGASFRKVIEE
jgi:hypothetical protein